LWFVIRHYGIEGLQFHIRTHVSLAQEFANWVQSDPDFELAAPAPLNLVCFRHKGGDEFNRSLLDQLNRSGRIYISHTILDGRFTLRVCIGQTSTELRHVKEAWTLIRDIAANNRSP
jgi:aromatic-L-amino-acid decarboxylase